MKKRALSLALALALLCGLIPCAAAVEFDFRDGISHYKDVGFDDWYYEEVMSLSVKGIVSGSGGFYRPADPVTRTEALKMVMEAMGIQLQSDPAGKAKWYSDYLYTAVQLGAADDAFAQGIDGSITRLEIAHLMAKLSGLPAGTTSAPFADSGDPDVAMLHANGITTGEKGPDGKQYYHGERTLTRAELATFTLRLLRAARQEKARALAPDYNLPANISWVEEPANLQEFIDDILIETLNGEYAPAFFFDSEEKAWNVHLYTDNIFGIRDIIRNYPAIYGLFSNLEPRLEVRKPEKEVLVCYGFTPEIDMATLYAQQQEALQFAKDLKQQLRDEGKITDDMTQKQRAHVYYDWLRSYRVRPSPSKGGLGGQNVRYDSAYAALHNKVANCVGRAAAYNMLLNVEGIPNCGLSGSMGNSGHVLIYMVFDGMEYIGDVNNNIPISPMGAGTAMRFKPNSQSLEYARALLAGAQ